MDYEDDDLDYNEEPGLDFDWDADECRCRRIVDAPTDSFDEEEAPTEDNLVNGRSLHSGVVCGSALFIYGGSDGYDWHSSLFRLNIGDSSCEKLQVQRSPPPALPRKRRCCSLVLCIHSVFILSDVHQHATAVSDQPFLSMEASPPTSC